MLSNNVKKLDGLFLGVEIMINLNKLFAKSEPYVSLLQHCCDTGETAGRLWDLGVIRKRSIKREHLCLLAAMHDIGKCHPAFQRIGLGKVDYIQELYNQGFIATSDRRLRHENVTEYILQERSSLFANEKTAKTFNKILRLHHQKKSNDADLTPSPRKKDWIKAQDQLIEKIEEYFGTKLSHVKFDRSDSVCTMLWGTVILADWLTSGGMSQELGIL